MTQSQAQLLIVDDQPVRSASLQRLLAEMGAVSSVGGVKAALDRVRGTPPQLILADVSAPRHLGFELCRQLEGSYELDRVPVILVAPAPDQGMEELGFSLGAVDFIHRPLSAATVRARVRNALRVHDHTRLLGDMISQRTRQLEATRLAIIHRLGRASEFKDDDTGLHVIRMSHYCRLIALQAGLSETAADVLLNAAPMHDIGKIGIPDRILQKPGKLDDDEWTVMRRHPAIGAGIIGRHDDVLLDTARVVALTHHEKWNGKGYPRGLGGEQIPLMGRIVAIADVFDALMSERPYKKAWALDKALGLIREESGAHFDPDLVECFFATLPQILEVRSRHLDADAAELPVDGALVARVTGGQQLPLANL